MSPAPAARGVVAFIDRHLDPVESLGEVLFGLIMVLTMTLGASLAAGYERGLLLEATGCNVAWGVIDGVLFVLSGRFERSRRGRIVRRVQRAPNDETALALIREELAPGISSDTTHEDREHFYRSVLMMLSHARAARRAIAREEILGAIAVFLLVAGTAVPAALPFLVVSDPETALRLSNLLLVALLFVVGFRWARYVDTNRWVAASTVAGLGVALVGVAVALGG